MKRLGVLVFILAGVLVSGCGRSDTIYADDGDGLVVIEHSALPDGFYDQSANRADAMSTGSQLRLRIRGGDSLSGTFNDTTLTGSRAIVGIDGYTSSRLADFDLHLESASSTTTSVRITLIVDLKCDGGTLRTLESSLPVGSSDVSSITSSAWTVAGSSITDSVGAVLLSSAPSSLNALLIEYPNACLKNGVSDAPDAPASIPLAAVQLSIGSGTSTSAEEVLISSLVLNGDTYSSWSPQ
jgi:hypothetical protein